MIEKIVCEDRCAGCGACENICPQNCIKLKIQKDGFFYPNVDKKFCIQCNMCLRVCPVLSQENKTKMNKEFDYKVYAAYSKNTDVREKSSSGGIFSELAIKVLENGGYVVGAAFNNKMELEHTLISDVNELDKLRGSKYVESRVGDIYRQIKNKIEMKKKVLFVGTPCQITGLKNFLPLRYHEQVYFITFICHGVPSSKSWKLFISELENKYKSKIKSIQFRDKTYGWKNYRLCIQLGKRVYKEFFGDGYWYRAFEQNIFLRKSCYDCRFKLEKLNSDICLGDLWGVEKYLPVFDQKLGSSAVLIETNKGEQLFKSIMKDIVFEPIDIDNVKKYNSSLVKPSSYTVNRDYFFELQLKYGFIKSIDLIFFNSLYKQIKKIIKKIFKTIYLKINSFKKVKE